MREKITTSGRIESSMKAPWLCSRPSHRVNRFGQAVSYGFTMLFINHRSCVLHCRLSRGDILNSALPSCMVLKLKHSSVITLRDLSSRYPCGCKYLFLQCAVSPWKTWVGKRRIVPSKRWWGDRVLHLVFGNAGRSLPAEGLRGDVFPLDPSDRKMAAKIPKVIKIYLQLQEKQNTHGMP